MKRIYIYALLSCAIVLGSCKKYLDIKSNNTQALISTARDCQLLLDNYDIMNRDYPAEGTLSADDYYVRAEEFGFSDISLEEKGLYTWDGTILPATDKWQGPYAKVNTTNVILEAIERIREKGDSDTQTLNSLRGAALFFRAYTHWQIAQLFASPYNAATADQDPGIPLKLSADINDVSQRGTLNQTYSGIIQDLQEAAGSLEATSVVPSRPNKAAAYALLARVYQSMEDYPSALQNASAALQLNRQLVDYNTLDSLSESPFVARYNKEVIFQSLMQSKILLTADYNGSDMSRIDSVLITSYATNDLRKGVFFNQNKVTRIDPATGENYKDTDGNDILFEDGTYHFTGNYEPGFTSNLFNGLTVDELYLIRAESYARAGDAASAMADLNTLLVSRWKTGTYVQITALGADDALEKVLIERRKELVMRGMRWTDLRRLNKDSRFAKTLNRNIERTAYALPPNDSRYTLLIPNEVIQFTNMVQNAR